MSCAGAFNYLIMASCFIAFLFGWFFGVLFRRAGAGEPGQEVEVGRDYEALKREVERLTIENGRLTERLRQYFKEKLL